MGAADRLHQRRSGRLPRRPAGPARRGGRARRSGRGRRCRGDDRRRDIRLGADTARERFTCRRTGHGRPTGTVAPPRRGRTQSRPQVAPVRIRRGRRVRLDVGGRGRPVSREFVATAKRLVVKVGSSALASPSGGVDDVQLQALVDALAARAAAGTQVVLVSSGAIAAGLKPLGLTKRPRDLATQQAAASVGQGLLVARYTAAFAGHGLAVGQVLLTSDDIVRRAHYRNAQRTFERLLSLGVVPVVNENDTVATEEIRYGDNDRLAALVTHLVRADALVLLSDVDGVYDVDPLHDDATIVRDVRSDADLAHVRLGRTGAAGVGSGGMATKLDAARIAAGAGVPTLL